ncbi:MAG TPA: SDR family NAD(P)-dependent oxidoreductase [Alphaproteobacteria bacterium]|nr:SDR family NAD(P)-dependent oxidoreductase [Alphaproteobacteria bacterium]
MGLMDGKVALVTGAGRGIGRAIALDMAKAGAKVVVNDLGGSLTGDDTGDVGPAQQVVNEIKAAGGEGIANTDSVSDWNGAQAMVGQAIDTFGKIDAVVNVAGILRDGMFHKMTEAEWDAVIDVHLKGCFNVSRAAIEPMREQESGAMVHFTSTSGLVGQIGQSNYAAAKMGIVGLSRVVAMEGAMKNVRSNCVAPFAWTRMIESIPIKSDEQAEAFEKFRANARPEHVAPVVTYLCSDAAAKISGNIFGVRGGEIYLMSQPRPVKTIHHAGGWTHEALAEMAEPALRNELYGLEGTGDYYSWDPI